MNDWELAVLIGRILVGAILISLLSSLGLLAITYEFGSMWIFPPRLILSCLVTVVMSLSIYFASTIIPGRQFVLVRRLVYLAIAVCMLPSMLPVGFLTGLLSNMTGAYDDPVGSHSDGPILNTIGCALLGLVAGPFWSCWAVLAASRRMKAAGPSSSTPVREGVS